LRFTYLRASKKFENMASVKDFSVEEKLVNLYKLQRVDSSIDEIEILRGELPMEVKD